MKHWFITIIICLFAGALTTVAVAWGIVCQQRSWTLLRAGNLSMGGFLHIEDGEESKQFALAVYNKRMTGVEKIYFDVQFWVSRDHNAHIGKRRGWEFDPPIELPFESCRRYVVRRLLNEPRGSFGLEAHGWPFIALWCEPKHVVRSPWLKRSREIPGYGRLPIPNDSLSTEYLNLPLLPVWSGFLLNTVIFGTAWLALILGVSGLRRGVRRWRKRCPQCGYRLHEGVATGCPECGWGRW